MEGIEARRIRAEQCAACVTIRARFGLRSAFDYLVMEKLVNFAEAASRHSGFARELPAFVAEVRRLFTIDELQAEFVRLESESVQSDLEDVMFEAEDDDAFREPTAVISSRAARFEMIKQLLLVDQLGIS
jgi:hypothetical protein